MKHHGTVVIRCDDIDDPFSTWLSILLFFFLSPLLKPRCQGSVMGFVGGGGYIAIATALPPSFVCIVLNTFNSLWYSYFFFMLA